MFLPKYNSGGSSTISNCSLSFDILVQAYFFWFEHRNWWACSTGRAARSLCCRRLSKQLTIAIGEKNTSNNCIVKCSTTHLTMCSFHLNQKRLQFVLWLSLLHYTVL